MGEASDKKSKFVKQRLEHLLQKWIMIKDIIKQGQCLLKNADNVAIKTSKEKDASNEKLTLLVSKDVNPKTKRIS